MRVHAATTLAGVFLIGSLALAAGIATNNPKLIGWGATGVAVPTVLTAITGFGIWYAKRMNKKNEEAKPLINVNDN